MKNLLLLIAILFSIQICQGNANLQSSEKAFNNMVKDWDSFRAHFAKEAKITITTKSKTIEGNFDQVLQPFKPLFKEFRLKTHLLEDLGNTVVSSYSLYYLGVNDCSHLTGGVTVTTFNDKHQAYTNFFFYKFQN